VATRLPSILQDVLFETRGLREAQREIRGTNLDATSMIFADTRKALDQVRDFIRTIGRQKAEVEVSANTDRAQRQLSLFEDENYEVEVAATVDADGLRRSVKIATKIAEAGQKISIPVEVDDAIARYSSILGGNIHQTRLFGSIIQDLKFPAMVTGLDAAAAATTALAAAGVQAIAGLSPLLGLVPAIGAAGIALAQGAGVGMLALGGLGDALKGLGDAQGRASADAARTAAAQESAAQRQEAAAKSVRSAERGVEQARESQAAAASRAADIVAAANKRVEDAEKGLAKVRQDQADAADRAAEIIVAANKRVEDAEKALVRARRDQADAAEQAADVIEAAAAKVENAEKRLESSLRDEERAQESLNDARREAARTLEDLRDKVLGNALDEESAALRVEEARQRLSEVEADANATAIERQRAALNVREAEAALAEQRKSGARDAAELAAAEAAGVEGSERVIDAQERVSSATDSTNEARVDLAKAEAGVGEAAEHASRIQQDAAASVAEAQADLIEAQNGVGKASEEARRIQLDAAVAVGEAQAGLIEAQQGVTRAAAEARDVQADAAESVALAIGRLTEAQAAAAQAAGKMGAAAESAGTAAMQAFEELPGTVQDFARRLFDLKPLLDDLKATAAGGLLPGLNDGLTPVLPLFESVKAIVAGTATTLGDLARRTGEVVASWQGDLPSVGESNRRVIESIGNAGISAADGLRHVLVAAQPLTEALADMVERGGNKFLEWAEKARGDGSLAAFFETTRVAVENLVGFIEGVAGALGNIFGIVNDQAGEGGFLGTLNRLVQQWEGWTNTVRGENAITDFFTESEPVLRELGALAKDIITGLFGGLGTGETDLAALIKQVREELLPVILKIASSARSDFGPAVITLLSNLGRIFVTLAGQSGFLTALVTTLGNLAGVFARFLENDNQVAGMVINLSVLGTAFRVFSVAPFVQSIGGLATTVGGGIRTIKQFSDGFTNNAAAIGAAANGTTAWATKFGSFASGISTHLTNAATSVGSFVVTLGQHVGTMLASLGRMVAQGVASAASFAAQTAASLGRAIASFAAMAAAHVAAGIQMLASAARWAAAQLIALGPIGLVIAAVIGLVALIVLNWDMIREYTLKIFRAISEWLAKTWDGIKDTFTRAITFVRAAWELWLDVLRIMWERTWSTIRDFFTGLWDGLKRWYDNAINTWKLAWEVWTTAIRIIWETVWNMIRDFFQNLWNGLTSWFHDRRNDLEAAWNAWTTILRMVWERAWSEIRTFFTNIWADIRRIWDGAIAVAEMAWNKFSDGARTVWDLLWAGVKYVLETAWDGIRAIFETIKTVATGIWDTFTGALRSTWETAFGAIETFFGTWRTRVEEGFTSLRDNVGKIWDGIKGKLEGPANFVINTVYNNGIKKVWNAIADFLQLTKLPDIDPIKLASGGRVPGARDPHGRDDVPARLTRGEYVMPVSAVDRYGTGFMDAVRSGSLMPGYALGGLVDVGRMLKEQFGARVSEHPAFGGVNGDHSRGSYHYSGKAIDVNTRAGQSHKEMRELDAVERWLLNPGNVEQSGILELLWREPGHYNHLHLAMRNGGAGGGAATGGGGGFFDGLGALADLASLPEQINTFMGGLGPLGAVLGGLGRKAVDGAKSFLTDKLNIFDLPETGSERIPDGGHGGPVERWRDEVIEALRIVGQPLSYADITLRRLKQESGGNPAAINKNDINWRNGTPSVGLMQVIGPTYQRHKHPDFDRGPFSYNSSLDPMSNILASMRYAVSRYGSLPKAYNKPGGYALGGLVDSIVPLAKGGTFTSPTLGLIAEAASARPEHVVGDRKLREAVREELAAVIGAERNGTNVTMGDVYGVLPGEIERQVDRALRKRRVHGR